MLGNYKTSWVIVMKIQKRVGNKLKRINIKEPHKHENLRVYAVLLYLFV